jgi:hypothetical protein
MTVLRQFVGKVREAGDAMARQIELPLRVAVCAWCRPHGALAEREPISHGICPRHLREMQLQLQGVFPLRRLHRRKVQGPPTGELRFLFWDQVGVT